MRATVILFVVAVIAIFGWKYRELWMPTTATDATSTTVTSPAETTVTQTDVKTTDKPSESGSSTNNENTQPAQAGEELDEEAEIFIETLTESDAEPIEIDQVDHFVSAEQTIALLPEDTITTSNPQDILNDDSLSPDTPITAVKQIEQIETVTPERLIAESGGDLEKTVVVVSGGGEETKTIRETLEAHSQNPDAPISIVKKVRFFEITTPAELQASLDTTVQGEELIGVIKRPYQLEAASISEILTAAQLLDPDSIFYVRTVKPTDVQGIWGIVQNGVVSNFARGIAVRRGEEINTYQVEIPPLADEVLPNKYSSFLGRLIYEKTQESYVYNYRENRMGRNPNNLSPGQEIVIIRFAPEELIGIYKHFVSESG